MKSKGRGQVGAVDSTTGGLESMTLHPYSVLGGLSTDGAWFQTRDCDLIIPWLKLGMIILN